MEKWASWQVFMIGIGLLFIMFSQQMANPFPMIIVLLGVIILKKSAQKERRKNGKW